jgi:hypothetical protein
MPGKKKAKSHEKGNKKEKSDNDVVVTDTYFLSNCGQVADTYLLSNLADEHCIFENAFINTRRVHRDEEGGLLKIYLIGAAKDSKSEINFNLRDDVLYVQSQTVAEKCDEFMEIFEKSLPEDEKPKYEVDDQFVGK